MDNQDEGQTDRQTDRQSDRPIAQTGTLTARTRRQDKSKDRLIYTVAGYKSCLNLD